MAELSDKELLEKRADLCEDERKLVERITELSSDEMDKLDIIQADIETIDRKRNLLVKFEGATRRGDEIISRIPPPADAAGEDRGVEHFETLGEQLVAVSHACTAGASHRIDPRLTASEMRATGMGESVPHEGGFTVDQSLQAGILTKTHARAQLYGRVDYKIPIGPGLNGTKIPFEDETSRADGSRSGGVQGYWIDEAGEITASTAKVGRKELSLFKLGALCYVTDELLQDSVALEGYIMNAYPKELAFKVDDAIHSGDGAGKPLGFATAANPAFIGITKETGQPAATILAENVEKVYARAWGGSNPNLEWYVNQSAYPQLFQLHHVIGMGGVPMFIEPGRLPDTPNGALLGKPIRITEHAAALGTVGDIVLADIKDEYIIIEKGTLQADTSIHVRFIYAEMAYRFILRINGQPAWNSALTPKDAGDTVSPFVGIATRA